jgi:hypothetical protein
MDDASLGSDPGDSLSLLQNETIENVIIKENNENSKWKGVVLDDGTGRNVYYVEPNCKTNARSRKVPEKPIIYEQLSNGERRFYYRGSCIRCKAKSPSIFITMKGGTMGFCINYCRDCIITTTPSISNNKITGNGDLIWEQHGHDRESSTPKIYVGSLLIPATAHDRNKTITKRLF